jgi:hypothetical protein
MGDVDRTTLAGMDGSDGSLESVRWAFKEAATRRAQLGVLLAAGDS